DAGTGHSSADHKEIDAVGVCEQVELARAPRCVQHRRGAHARRPHHGRRYPSTALVSSERHSDAPIREDTALWERIADCTISRSITEMSPGSPCRTLPSR